jgi:hypothetical protein
MGECAFYNIDIIGVFALLIYYNKQSVNSCKAKLIRCIIYILPEMKCNTYITNGDLHYYAISLKLDNFVVNNSRWGSAKDHLISLYCIKSMTNSVKY